MKKTRQNKKIERISALTAGLIGLCVLGAAWPALANECRADLNACVAASQGRPHICDPLVKNLPICEENERKGITQVSINPKLTKAAIFALYSIK